MRLQHAKQAAIGLSIGFLGLDAGEDRDRRGGRAAALAHLERQGQECPSQYPLSLKREFLPLLELRVKKNGFRPLSLAAL